MFSSIMIFFNWRTKGWYIHLTNDIKNKWIDKLENSCKLLNTKARSQSPQYEVKDRCKRKYFALAIFIVLYVYFCLS